MDQDWANVSNGTHVVVFELEAAQKSDFSAFSLLEGSFQKQGVHSST